MADHPLHYPNLAGCSVKLNSPTISNGGAPPKTLPVECRSAVQVDIPAIYDFELEKTILKKKEDREKDMTASSASGSDQDDLERAVLVKMKSVTGANDDVCIALLESNSYDLKTSIEMFFQSSP